MVGQLFSTNDEEIFLAKKNYIFAQIWGGFEATLGDNLEETVDVLDRSARNIETDLFCVIPEGENTTCDAVLEQIWEENGLPLNRDLCCAAPFVTFSTLVAFFIFISFL